MARAYNQAQKFGVEMAIPDEVESLLGQSVSDEGRFLLTLANKERVRARTVVIASGARYRRLDVGNLASFEGSCVHYWASPVEGRLCAGQEVALVGRGNSAGQAAVYLSSQVAKVRLIVRGPGLETNMSRCGRAHCRKAERRNPDRDDGHYSRRAERDSRSDPLSLLPIR